MTRFQNIRNNIILGSVMFVLLALGDILIGLLFDEPIRNILSGHLLRWIVQTAVLMIAVHFLSAAEKRESERKESKPQ